MYSTVSEQIHVFWAQWARDHGVKDYVSYRQANNQLHVSYNLDARNEREKTVCHGWSQIAAPNLSCQDILLLIAYVCMEEDY